MIHLLAAFVTNTFLFYSGGLFLAIRVFKVPTHLVWVVAILSNAILGYLGFWMYFFSPFLGKLFSILTLVLSVWAFRYPELRKQIFSRPLLLTLLIGAFYIALLDPALTLQSIQLQFLTQRFPQDNEFPFVFAEKLFFGQNLQHLISPYLSSDRPPLQTGLTLLGMPILGKAFGHEAHYQALAMVLQLTWVIAFCAHSWRAAPIFLAFLGFFFVQSTFVWPKMFAGVLGLYAVRLWMDEKPKLSALSLGMGMLAHSGVVFVAPVFLFLGKRRWTDGSCMVLIIAALYLPWMGYQKFVAPPGNYVAKDLLAGIQSVETESTARALNRSYAKLSFTEVIRNKFQNLSSLLGPPAGSAWKSRDDWKYSEFFHLARVFGILGLLLFLLRGRLALGILASTLIWCLILFGPATAMVHHYSYALILLILWMLLDQLQKTPVPLQWSIVGVQVFQFFYLWR